MGGARDNAPPAKWLMTTRKNRTPDLFPARVEQEYNRSRREAYAARELKRGTMRTQDEAYDDGDEVTADELNFNWLAMMTTVAARHALAMGYERETVARCLIDLGNAIRTQDAAENMGPFDLEMLG